MENTLLEDIKRVIVDTQNILNNNFAELDELKNNPIVQRYNRITRLKYLIDHGLTLDNDDKIIRHEYWKYTQGKIIDTNNLWFLLGIYSAEKYRCVFSEEPDMLNDSLVYINLENEKMRVVIDLNQKEVFESEHVIINTSSEDDWSSYYKMREKFFVDCVNEGQEIAVEKILRKVK